MPSAESGDIWEGDLLGFAARGVAFTNLVTSITDHRTLSIEAGYGHGKTFFRERWARQLEAAGECVVQIDARLSDHSGDPGISFLSALLALVPEGERTTREKVFGEYSRPPMAIETTPLGTSFMSFAPPTTSPPTKP